MKGSIANLVLGLVIGVVLGAGGLSWAWYEYVVKPLEAEVEEIRAGVSAKADEFRREAEDAKAERKRAPRGENALLDKMQTRFQSAADGLDDLAGKKQ